MHFAQGVVLKRAQLGDVVQSMPARYGAKALLMAKLLWGAVSGGKDVL